MGENIIKWRMFYLKDLFNIEKGTRLIKEDRVGGNIPFVTAGNENQGIKEYISNSLKIHNNCITIDMFGKAFYHDYDFSCDDNVHVLTLKNHPNKLNKYNGLFITTIINNDKRWNYGKQYRLKTFKNHKIILPITNDEDVNYDYMTQFMQDIEKEKIEKYEQILQKIKNKRYSNRK